MCFIGGCFFLQGSAPSANTEQIVRRLIASGATRGPDGAGAVMVGTEMRFLRDLNGAVAVAEQVSLEPDDHTILINARLEPTCEWLPNPQSSDLQPYECDGIAAVHNGIISNDQSLRSEYAISTAETQTAVDSAIIPVLLGRFGGVSRSSLEKLAAVIEGSYAIIVHDRRNPEFIFVICSYKPVWKAFVPALGIVCFASESGQLLDSLGEWASEAKIERIPPYSGQAISRANQTESFTLDKRLHGDGTLCVISGGMDSTTAAAIAIARGERVTFCHFLYGCKAESRERQAVVEIAKHYSSEAIFIPLPWLGSIGGSSLTVDSLEIAVGNAAVETAHEWVPARNLLLISHAVALCERHGFGRIVVGLNEQEGEVFPDNELEFLANLQDAITIGSTHRVELDAPVGRMSKRDILRTALSINVPLGLTWSCYKAGKHPCGSCGSCLQRRVAFLQLGLEDFIEYENAAPVIPISQAT